MTWPGGAGTLVTQSGDTLPSGNSPRTIEFWDRAAVSGYGGSIETPTIVYGGTGGTNDQFNVQLSRNQDGLLSLSTDGQTFNFGLPARWDDGGWHLFDVTYDGTQVTGYMDGQTIGSSPVTAPLATATPGNGFAIEDNQTGNCCSRIDLAEVAVYPTALSPARVDAHWTAAESVSGPCVAAPTDPYGQAVVSDAPAVYLRLGDLVSGSNGRAAFDYSGHCTALAPTNGAYTSSAAAQPDGPALGSSDGAITWPGGAVTLAEQSGATLPSGNSPRTIEFWDRAAISGYGGSIETPTIVYGGTGGTNDQFNVQLGLNQDGLLSLSTDGQTFNFGLPARWDDGGWHLFDITYNGSTAVAYMDGQVVGSKPVPIPLATVTPGNGLAIADNQSGNCCSRIDLAEVAVYPTVLTSARILAHFEARFAAPPGMSIIAGTASFGTGGGAPGSRAQACPPSGGACTVDPYPADPSGFFHILVPNATYTVTVFPPASSPSVPQVIPNVTVPPNALNLTATFSPPGGLPSGVTVSTPGGTQQNVVPGSTGAAEHRSPPLVTGGVGMPALQGPIRARASHRPHPFP